LGEGWQARGWAGGASRLAEDGKTVLLGGMNFFMAVMRAAGGLSLALLAHGAEEEAMTLVLKEKAKLEIQREGKTTGTVSLAAGTELIFVEIDEDWLRVKFRSLEGRVPVAATDFIDRVGAAQQKAKAKALEKAGAETKAEAMEIARQVAESKKGAAKAKPNPPKPAPSAMMQLLEGKLVKLQGSGIKPVAAEQLAGVKFYAIYFSASWCGPCKEFTPGFVDAYRKIREIYPEFETVFVSRDRSEADTMAYMKADKMPWATVRWDELPTMKELDRYAGPGIPCLVLVDEKGKVLSDSFRRGNYAGPGAVLEDAWKLLKEYRRKNPRAKM